MSGDAQVLVVIWAFWLAVIGLDLAALLNLRRSHVRGTARALWAIWIVGAPVVGPLSYFIVGPDTPRAMRAEARHEGRAGEEGPVVRAWHAAEHGHEDDTAIQAPEPGGRSPR
jgi:hypothetical protein